jgi:transketolase
VIGDGESQEGQIWEAAMSAPKYKVDTLTAILDYNHGQIDGPVDQVMSIEPVIDKWRAFNWNVLEIDGHDMGQISSSLDRAKAVKDKPTFIVAHTVKGKGVSFMENQIAWHGMAPNAEQTAKALAELRSAYQRRFGGGDAR